MQSRTCSLSSHIPEMKEKDEGKDCDVQVLRFPYQRTTGIIDPFTVYPPYVAAITIIYPPVVYLSLIAARAIVDSAVLHLADVAATLVI